ncbi:DUF6869 domain-containing protein [Sanyastnella coralliicola]|uniref:DUF6869 domain-containing protein n=1 Tax=Sanyastnella coralliicola TaxID=3069118 RepID=UPI0027BA419C|nr:hypothetical protein [Longitalea sp. SCSIO 12813]
MNGDKVNLDELTSKWIAYQASSDPNLHWAIFAFDDLTYNEPHSAWEAIKMTFEKARTAEEIVGMIAAGPLENLLTNHGEMMFSLVAEYTKANPNFKNCLRGVWLEKSNTVYEKFQRLAGKPEF